MAQSEAARRLEEVLFPKDERMTVARLAEHLGVTRQAVHAWIRGESKPRSDHMSRIEELTGIPMQAWFGDPDAEAEAS